MILITAIKHTFFNHRLLSVVARNFYNYFYSIEKIGHLRINNWGYSPVDEEIAVYPPDLRYGMQLYKELVRSERGYWIPQGCSIVEIGCGKGAGAEFIVKRFRPSLYTGIDYSKVAIDFCLHSYTHLPNTEFICADVHQIPFTSESKDVVVSVESSHIYKNIGKVFSEVYRILKPGGRFLLTDFRVVKNCTVEEIEETILDCGFIVLNKKMITKHVYEACSCSTSWRKALVQEASPQLLKRFFYHYAVLEGTEKFKKLGNGEIVYFMYQLEKPSN